MSHRLRRKPPGIVSVAAWGPWSRKQGRGGACRPDSGGSGCRRRGGSGGGDRGGRELPRGVLGAGWDGRRRLAGVLQHAGGGMARERAWKRRERDGMRRARASVSRGESILIPRLEGEGPEGRIDVQPEFRRSLMEAGGTGANFRPR